MNPLEPLEGRIAALIANLTPAARKQMAAGIARKLRASQQRNIKSQKSPDGTPFKPRREQPIRGKKGRVKREMFAKLRTAKYLKAKGTDNDAVVGFTGRVLRMVRVHHYGLSDRPARGRDAVRYDARPLLGFSDADIELVEREIMDRLAE